MLRPFLIAALFCILNLNAMADEASDLFDKRTFSNADGQSLNYRIHVPDLNDSAGKNSAGKKSTEKIPLVLFLHGAGERGDDNEAQLKHGAREFLARGRDQRFPAVVVVPQCPEDKRWVETNWTLDAGGRTFPDQPSESMSLVFQLIDELRTEQNIDSSRLYVTGLSMGGFGCWYAAASYRGVDGVGFSAMLAVCGGGDPGWADRYQDTDLWCFHGNSDSVVPVQRSREMVAAIARAGHPGELRYTEYPGVQHDSWTQTYSSEETFRWLFSQSASSSK